MFSNGSPLKTLFDSQKLWLNSTEDCKVLRSGRWVPFASNRRESGGRMRAEVCWFSPSEGHNGYLVRGFGWGVRRMVDSGDEMRRVAHVQAEAFHVPVSLFNDFFFDFFEAEVLSALIYRIKNSPSNRYACLVAESIDVQDSPSIADQGLVGVVDVTVQRDGDVVRHLESAEEYLYVSGMAVLTKYRRQKIATVLLKACDELSIKWGFSYLALRAYEDDSVARRLYLNAGYQLASIDPHWVSWIGRKRRVLMIKPSILPQTPFG